MLGFFCRSLYPLTYLRLRAFFQVRFVAESPTVRRRIAYSPSPNRLQSVAKCATVTLIFN